MIGDKTHQVELAQHAQDLVAVAHQQAVHAVLDHQEQRLEDLGIGLDLDQLEACDLAHRQLRRRRVAQQGVAQVGGGEHAQPLLAGRIAVTHQRMCQAVSGQLAAAAHQVRGAVQVIGLADVGIADACRDQREHLALGFCRVGSHGTGLRHRSRTKTSGAADSVPAAPRWRFTSDQEISGPTHRKRRYPFPSGPAGRRSPPCPAQRACCRREPRTARCPRSR